MHDEPGVDTCQQAKQCLPNSVCTERFLGRQSICWIEDRFKRLDVGKRSKQNVTW